MRCDAYTPPRVGVGDPPASGLVVSASSTTTPVASSHPPLCPVNCRWHSRDKASIVLAHWLPSQSGTCATLQFSRHVLRRIHCPMSFLIGSEPHWLAHCRFGCQVGVPICSHMHLLVIASTPGQGQHRAGTPTLITPASCLVISRRHYQVKASTSTLFCRIVGHLRTFTIF